MTELAQSADGLEEIGRDLLEKINAEWQKKTSGTNLNTSREPTAAVTREFIIGALKLFFGRYEDLMGVFSQNMYNLFDRRLIEIQEGQALGKDMLSLLALYVGQQQNECLLCNGKEKQTEYNALSSEVRSKLFLGLSTFQLTLSLGKVSPPAGSSQAERLWDDSRYQ